MVATADGLAGPSTHQKPARNLLMHRQKMIAARIDQDVLGATSDGVDTSTPDARPEIGFCRRQPKILRPVRLDVDNPPANEPGAQLVGNDIDSR